MPRRLVNKKLSVPPSHSIFTDLSSFQAQRSHKEENEEEYYEDLETQVPSVSSSDSFFWEEEASERATNQMKLGNDEGRMHGQGLLKMLQQGRQAVFPFEDEHGSKPAPHVQVSAPPKILLGRGNSMEQAGYPWSEEEAKMPARHTSSMRPMIPQRDARPFGQVGNPLRAEGNPLKDEGGYKFANYPNQKSLPKVLQRDSQALNTQMEPQASFHDDTSFQEPQPRGQPHGYPQAKAKLRSSASLFVPQMSAATAAPPPPPPFAMPQGVSQKSGQLPIRCIVEGAFGNRLCDLSMVDQDALTEVNVVVSENAYPTGYSWELDPLAQSRAMHVLLEAFKILGPKLKSLEPTADNTQLNLKYSEVPSETLCWEFAKNCFCPRAACRWVHAALEIFIINIILQPVVPATQATQVLVVPGMVPVIPVASPLPNTTEGLDHPTAREEEVGKCDKNGDATNDGSSVPSQGTCERDCPTRPDRVCWADIEDDEEAQFEAPQFQ